METAVRKAGATKMVGSNPTREALEDIAEHMAYTTVTSEKFTDTVSDMLRPSLHLRRFRLYLVS